MVYGFADICYLDFDPFCVSKRKYKFSIKVCFIIMTWLDYDANSCAAIVILCFIHCSFAVLSLAYFTEHFKQCLQIIEKHSCFFLFCIKLAELVELGELN